jgi:hypothetical protein
VRWRCSIPRTVGFLLARELVDRLFLHGRSVKRLATLPVFESLKLGLELPFRRPDGD